MSAGVALIGIGMWGPRLAEELAEFGRCIGGGDAPETGAEEGIQALRAILEALEAWAPAPL